jgi:hypothetical protein
MVFVSITKKLFRIITMACTSELPCIQLEDL